MGSQIPNIFIGPTAKAPKQLSATFLARCRAARTKNADLPGFQIVFFVASLFHARNVGALRVDLFEVNWMRIENERDRERGNGN